MSNTSATGGPLLPSGIAPLYGAALEDFFQGILVNLTGLTASLVRPQWQSNPPTQPAPSVDWLAFGVTTQDETDYPAIVHSSAGQGSDTMIYYEQVKVPVSLYGPNCAANIALLRANLYVPQNREPLQLQGMALVDMGNPVRLAEQVNNQWIDRYDATIRFTRELNRSYAVLNLESAAGTVGADGSPANPSNPFTVNFTAG